MRFSIALCALVLCCRSLPWDPLRQMTRTQKQPIIGHFKRMCSIPFTLGLLSEWTVFLSAPGSKALSVLLLLW